jgi:hypothetical protein
VELPLRSLFEGPTVAEVAKAIKELKERGTAARAPSIKPIARESRRVKRSELLQATSDVVSQQKEETRKSA